MTVGTLMVGIDATAASAKKTMKQFTAEVGEEVKKIGNMKVGEGSIFSREHVGNAIAFAREQFMGMITDIEEFQAAAKAAGMTIEEFTGGAFTQEDVKRASEFSDAIERFGDAFKGARKEVLIDISPLASDTINRLADFVEKTGARYSSYSDAVAPIGEAIGNAAVPTPKSGTPSRLELEAKDIVNRTIGPLINFGLNKNKNSDPDQIEAFRVARDARELQEEETRLAQELLDAVKAQGVGGGVTLNLAELTKG